MPTAPQFEWPQGEPLFETQWRAVTESLAGNGVLNAGDLQLTPGTATREVAYAAGTVYYVATQYNESAGTVTVSAGDANEDRWDTIAYDTATPGVEVKEGTPAANPEPPDVDGDEILLGVVYVPQNFDDVLAASQILNWRGRVSNEAEEVLYTDDTGVYGVNNVDAALDELQEAAQISAYPLANSDLANSTVTVNAGNALATTNASISLGGSTTLSVPTDGIQLDEIDLSITPTWTGQHRFDAGLDTRGDLVDDATTIWDTANGFVPRASLDDKKAVTTVTSSTYTTSDEEAVLVDTAAIGGASTITLASADAEIGNTIVVADLTGSADNNPITVETEGSETIHGVSSKTIESTGGALVFTSDGTNWALGGGGAGGDSTVFDTYQTWLEQSTPSGSPDTNYWRIYLKSDGNIYVQDDAGNESQVGGATTDTRTNVSDDGTEIVADTLDINFAAGVEVTDDGDDTVTVDVKEPITYDPGITEWEDGLSSEEVYRLVLQSGETLVVERIEFRQKGGGSSTSASIDVRDVTAASTIGSQTLGGTTKDPGSSGAGNTILVRVTNSTGGAINAAPRVIGHIEGA